MARELTDADRAVVIEALEEIRSAPRPPDRAPLGCVVALPGFVLLLIFPPVGRMLDVTGGVASAVLGIGLVLLVVGLGLWFTAGGAVRAHRTAAAEAALRRLEAWDPASGDREQALRAATLLLAHAYATYGATTVASFEVEGASRRIGVLMPIVEAVERLLVAEGAAHPVFTETAPAHEDDGPAG